MIPVPTRSLAVLSLLAPLLLLGCAAPRNPSFSITQDQAEAALQQMRAAPKPLPRPVLVLSGWMDPGLAPARTADRLRAADPGAAIVTVHFFGNISFDGCRARVFEALRAAREDPAFEGIDPLTAEYDVVAFSMGGLIARLAAAPPPPKSPQLPEDEPEAPADTSVEDQSDRLRIARLFTISTPHRGAVLAVVPTPSLLINAMRPGSDQLAAIDRARTPGDYAIIPYVRLRDPIVGTAQAAPRGESPWWLPTPLWELPHNQAIDDPRILADILRRLRGEPPFATEPRAPLPG